LEALLERRDDRRVMVALQFEEGTEPDLIHLPWEHLYVPQEQFTSGIHLAIEPTVGFARTVSAKPIEYKSPQGQTLTALIVAVKPTSEAPQADGTTPPAELVERVVFDMQRTAEDVTGFVVNVIDTPTAFEIEEQLNDVDIVHYVGFGRFENNADQIALGSEAGGVDYVSIGAFADSLKRGKPRLVVLQLCRGTRDVVPADFSVLAPTLLERIPAVIAHQYPVDPIPASRFNRVLYEQLAQGATIEAAVQQARNKLRLTRAFVSPALFVAGPGDLRIVAARREFAPAQRAKAASYA
jgi:CHAT domain-containing protein